MGHAFYEINRRVLQDISCRRSCEVIRQTTTFRRAARQRVRRGDVENVLATTGGDIDDALQWSRYVAVAMDEHAASIDGPP